MFSIFSRKQELEHVKQALLNAENKLSYQAEQYQSLQAQLQEA